MTQFFVPRHIVFQMTHGVDVHGPVSFGDDARVISETVSSFQGTQAVFAFDPSEVVSMEIVWDGIAPVIPVHFGGGHRFWGTFVGIPGREV